MNLDPARHACSGWIAKAQAAVHGSRLAEILQMMVDIPSPTGEEGALARGIVDSLAASHIDATEQVIDAHQSNAFAELPGIGAGPSLLLYSPIDTVTANSIEEDLPWAGPELRADMRAQSWIDNGHVFGLGAQNPKGHAACVLGAGEAIKSVGVPLSGNVYLGFGAGGMPTNARHGMREDSGHGAGCTQMLNSMPKPDAAVIAKSGWSVSWEEVGLSWYTVQVQGTHSYVGSRHLLPFSNAITNAGRLIERLETWFSEWAEEHRSGLVAPQGVVSQIESGWSRMPAFTPAMCQFQLDLRVSPRTSATEVDAALGQVMETICKELELEASWQRTVFIPGTHTDPDAQIIQTCIRAWEASEGRPHTPTRGLSGATDANILRMAGIPTARIGLNKAALPDMDFELGMNVASIDDLQRLTRLLVEVAIDTCFHKQQEKSHG